MARAGTPSNPRGNHPSCSALSPSSPRLIHSLAAPAADTNSEIISFAKRTAKDLKLSATFVPRCSSPSRCLSPLSLVPPSLLGFTAFLLIYNGLAMLFSKKRDNWPSSAPTRARRCSSRRRLCFSRLPLLLCLIAATNCLCSSSSLSQIIGVRLIRMANLQIDL
jgi:hypothetical protein